MRSVTCKKVGASSPRSKRSAKLDIQFNGKQVIESSRMVILLKDIGLTQGAKLGDAEDFQINEKYPWRGVHSDAVNRCNGLKIPVMHEGTKISYEVEVRAFNDVLPIDLATGGGFIARFLP